MRFFRRFISIILLGMLIMVISVSVAMAQTISGVSDLDLYTFVGLMAAVLVLEELVDRVWDLNGVASQVRSIVIGIVGTTALAAAHLFMFSDPAVYGTHEWYVAGPLIGLGAGLASNFAFLLPAVRAILESLGIRPRWDPSKGLGMAAKPDDPVRRMQVK